VSLLAGKVPIQGSDGATWPDTGSRQGTVLLTLIVDTEQRTHTNADLGLFTMNIDLAGKTAVVTGSSAGIGWGCARGLAEADATVVITGRNPESLAAARTRVLDAVRKANVRTVVADLSTAAGCASLAKAEPACDILVNSLGAYEPKPFLDTPDDDWERLFQTNVMSGVRLSRAYLPALMQRGWGRIIFFSSVDAVVQSSDSLHYDFTKTAVLGISRGLAKLAGDSGVTVNAVLPGVTRVEWLEDLIESMKESPDQSFEEASRAAVTARFPTSIDKRVHRVEEVANLVVYLCSIQASATTGSALRADGGIVESIV
jgi:NAD(P)-dependent dehydrogenase (short-subunit alcohol dehydrogenase family)